MRLAKRAFSRNLVSMMACSLMLFVAPLSSSAEEKGVQRPWGNVKIQKPSHGGQPSTSQGGYLGRYNPWLNQQGDNKSETPVYRQHNNKDAPSKTQPAPAYYQQPPYSPVYPSTGLDRFPVTPPLYAPYPGLSPWSGGVNPLYGNYWNDPYDSMHPNTGILWSDMWRW